MPGTAACIGSRRPTSRRWRPRADRRTTAILAQVGAAAVLLALLGLLGRTLGGNLARLNLWPDFSFLLRPAGLRMGEGVVAFEPTDSFAWAMFAAGLNTVRVCAVGIVLATVLGVMVGVMRLSRNPLLAALTTAYVELFRNTPVLLQILLWSAIMLGLPDARHAVSLGDWLFVSQRGIQVPALLVRDGWRDAGPVLAAAAAGAAVAAGLIRRKPGALAAGALAFGAVAVAGLAVQGGMGLERPVRRLFGIAGGVSLTPEYCALVLGLSAYAGAFIAEIVRGGILSVKDGQWEAARSLGLRDAAIMRRVVLPQALRVIVPALATQYVSLIKNSSLAIAVGFPDLFWAASSAINATGRAIEGVVVLVAGYLLLTLGTATVMNLWYGRMLRRGGR